MIYNPKDNTQQIKNNAIIAYLFIIVNILFLFTKNNKLINNEFVKSHTKTAILIHIWFLINTIIFAYLWLGFYKEFIWYNISDIIAIIIYLALFSLMIVWMYKAYNNELFKLWETIKYKNNEKLLDVTLDWKFSEKDKVTIIISRIPFIWFFIFPKYKNNEIILSNTKLNLYITLLIMILYIFWNPNLANLLLLLYIIFIVFSSINLFIRNEVININTKSLLFGSDILNYIKAISIYMFNYFSSKKDFLKFWDVLKQVILKENKNEEIEIKNQNSLNNFKLWKYIVYIPLINFICLFNLNSKQKFHIINWILISITLIILYFVYWINNKYFLILTIPLAFAIWNLNAWIMNYKIPFLYNIFNILLWIKNHIIDILNKIRKVKNTQKQVNLKVNKN